MIHQVNPSPTGAHRSKENGAPVHQTVCLECWNYAKDIADIDEKLSRSEKVYRPVDMAAEYAGIYKSVHIDGNHEHYYHPKAKAKRKAGKLLHLSNGPRRRQAQS